MWKVKSSRKGIANVFGEVYSKLYDEDQHDETEMKSDNNETENYEKSWLKFPKSQHMNYRKQLKDSWKAKQRSAMESKPKT